MKRDLDLVRQILLDVESAAEPLFGVKDLVIEGFDEAAVIYHVDLLAQAGLLDATVDPYKSGGTRVLIRKLTWPGHDYLDAVRDDTVWARTKSQIGGAVGTTALEVVKAVAIAITKNMLGLL